MLKASYDDGAVSTSMSFRYQDTHLGPFAAVQHVLYYTYIRERAQGLNPNLKKRAM